MNKIDIFEEKLKYIPLTKAFPEYEGNCSETEMKFSQVLEFVDIFFSV
jgi:hypothetical protein